MISLKKRLTLYQCRWSLYSSLRRGLTDCRTSAQPAASSRPDRARAHLCLFDGNVDFCCGKLMLLSCRPQCQTIRPPGCSVKSSELSSAIEAYGRPERKDLKHHLKKIALCERVAQNGKSQFHMRFVRKWVPCCSPRQQTAVVTPLTRHCHVT